MNNPDYKYKWCNIVLDVLKKETGSPIIDQFRVVLEYTYKRKDKRGLSSCFRDIQEWADSLDAPLREEINNRMVTELGSSLADHTFASTRIVDRIIAAGKIRSVEEYEIISVEVERIHDDETKTERVQLLNKLLLQFE